MSVLEQVVFGIKQLALTPYAGGTTVYLNNPEDFTVDASVSVEELYGGTKPWAIAAGIKDIKGKISGSSATLSLDALQLLTGTGAITSVGTPAVDTLNFSNTAVPSYWKAEARIEMSTGEVVTYVYNRVFLTGYKIGGKRGTFTLMDFSAMILTDPATGNIGYIKREQVTSQANP
jgi:hypothetical protein